MIIKSWNAKFSTNLYKHVELTKLSAHVLLNLLNASRQESRQYFTAVAGGKTAKAMYPVYTNKSKSISFY